MKEIEDLKMSKKDAIDCLAYLESCCQDEDAGYYPYVIKNYIRDLEAELGLSLNEQEEEQRYNLLLAKYRENA